MIYLFGAIAVLSSLITAWGVVGALQRSRYARSIPRRYLGWLPAFALSLATGVLSECYPRPLLLWMGVGLVPVILTPILLLSRRRYPKCKARPMRLWGLSALPIAGAIVALTLLRAGWVAAIAALTPLFVRLLALLLSPWEEKRKRRFVLRMRDKLTASGATIIGITGSAGKTTVKTLLAAALGENAYPTKGNYNTPMGLALSIKDMPPATRYFVAEMGISHMGDMDDLLGVVTPSVGVLTNVLPQHTLTAGGVENIRREKSKLLSAASLSIAPVGFGASVSVGEGCDYFAKDVRLGKEETSFVVVTPKGEYPVTLPLLGRGCVTDCVFAFAAALAVGISPEIVVQRLAQIKRVPHRMDLVANARSVTIVDDSYNLNLRGVQYAMEYVDLYAGRKVVAVSGIAESDPALRLNEELGRIVSRADLVIVVGDRYRDQLLQGIGRTEGVYTVSSTKESVTLYRTLLRAGDVLLILADMPL